MIGIWDLRCCKKDEEKLSDFESRLYFNEKFELFEKDSFNTFINRQAEKHEAHFEYQVRKQLEKIIEMKGEGENNSKKDQIADWNLFSPDCLILLLIK